MDTVDKSALREQKSIEKKLWQHTVALAVTLVFNGSATLGFAYAMLLLAKRHAVNAGAQHFIFGIFVLLGLVNGVRIALNYTWKRRQAKDRIRSIARRMKVTVPENLTKSVDASKGNPHADTRSPSPSS